MAISAMSSQISSEEDRIRTWLTTLSASGRGRIHLANMFLCLRYEIIQKEQLRRFALACLSAHPSLDAEYVFHQVCRQTKGTELLFFGLASIDKNAIDKDESSARQFPMMFFTNISWPISIKQQNPASRWMRSSCRHNRKKRRRPLLRK